MYNPETTPALDKPYITYPCLKLSIDLETLSHPVKLYNLIQALTNPM